MRNIIGRNVKYIRKLKGMTQEELTAKLNVYGIEIDRPMVSRIENDDREVYDYEVKAIAKVLCVPIERSFND